MSQTIKSEPSLEILQIALVCHQANKAWCEANDDTSQKDWHSAENWQRQSAINGVITRIGSRNAGHDLQHNAWLEDKKKDGWVYGEVKDAEAKTHPCIVPFEELPEFQKKKDALFCAIVDSLSANKTLTITPLK
jgi:hypothetical protein